MPRLPLLHGTSPVQDLYSRALSSAYKQEFRIIEPAFSEEREPDIWELVQRDGRVVQAIEQRTSRIASKEWAVQPRRQERAEDVRLASFVEDLLREIPGFREARKRLAQAVFRGRAYAYIESGRRTVELGDLPAERWWIPRCLKDVDKRRVQMAPKTVRLQGDVVEIQTPKELWSVERERWEEIRDSRPWVEITYRDEESRLGYGRGLLDALYFLWWAKTIVLKQGLQALERWASGILVGKVDPQGAGAEGRDPETARDDLRDELKKHRTDHVLTIDKNDDLEVHGLTGQGHQLVKDFLQYLDDGILATAMGAVLPFGGGLDKGSMARAEVEEEVSDELLEFDRGKVDEALTAKLIGLVVSVNRPLLEKHGLGRARAPIFATGTTKTEDPQKNVTVVEVALRSGVPLKKDEVYEKIGFTPPGPEDEVIEAPAQSAAGGLGALFGGQPGGNQGNPAQNQTPTGGQNGPEERPAPKPPDTVPIG